MAFEDYAFNIPTFAKNFKKRKPSTDHWMNLSIGSSLDNKEDIEPVSGLSFDWRELPDRKASRIVLEKSVQFANKSQWESQFEWLADVMVKMKAAFCKYI